jgi:hypothetical protein
MFNPTGRGELGGGEEGVAAAVQYTVHCMVISPCSPGGAGGEPGGGEEGVAAAVQYTVQ